ncbi:MAG: FHA domain-containing protein [Chthonomonadales bacterium]
MSQDEATRVMSAPQPGFDKTMVAGMTPPADATQMGVSTVCPVCKSSNSGLETYCGDCGFLLASAPGTVSVPESTDAATTLHLVETSSGRSLSLKSGDNIVGRENCDVLIMDGTVSRRHALLNVTGETVTLTDFGSTNGTQVDGVRLSPNLPTPVTVGSNLRFGSASMTLAQPGTEVASPAPVPAEVTVQVGAVPEVTFEPTMIGTPVAEAAPVEAEAPAEEAAIASPVEASLSEDSHNLVAILTSTGEFDEIRLASGTSTLGRRESNDIIISTDPFVSGNHAKFESAPLQVFITDVGSTNGTTVNGTRLNANVDQYLVDGDEISFGKSEFKFHYFTLGEPLPAAVPVLSGELEEPVISHETGGHE